MKSPTRPAPRLLPRRPRRFVPLVLPTIVALAIAAPADAYFDRGTGYSHGSTDCSMAASDRKDPVTAIMWGKELYSPYHVQEKIYKLVGWAPNFIAKNQYFTDHGQCVESNVQASDRPGRCKCNRWHLRGGLQLHENDRGHWVTLTPHRDIWQEEYYDRVAKEWRCQGAGGGKHYVHRNTGNGSGFDRGRKKLKEKRNMGNYYTGHSEWGNTRTSRQCNGQLAGSNGWVAYFGFGK